jgi:hypothetical protein
MIPDRIYWCDSWIRVGATLSVYLVPRMCLVYNRLFHAMLLTSQDT